MYPKEVREEAVRLVESGLSPKEVSKRMGGSPGYAIIRRWASGYVPVQKRRTGKLYTMEDKLRALRRLADGEDYNAVGESIGCAGTTVLTWRRLFKQQGVKGLRTRVDEM